MIEKPWGTGLVNGDVGRKSCWFFFTLNAYQTHTLCTEIFIFHKFDDKITHFLMYWTLHLSIKIIIPWDIILIRQVLPKIMPFYLKFQFCLGPILDINHQYFTSLMTNILYFFEFWTFSPQL